MKHLLLFPILLLNHFVFGQCNSTSYAELDINNVTAGLLGAGDMWWDGIDERKYHWTDPASGEVISTIFSNGLWISGLSPSGDLKLAGMTYRNQGFDFYPGPIDDVTGMSTTNCSLYDQHFKVHSTTIDDHVNDYLQGTINIISPEILEWPAKGNTYYAAQSIYINQEVAPFVDVNGNGLYDPEFGDFPNIKGHQAIFWVFNDVGVHSRTGGETLGIEIHMMAYAFSQQLNEVDNTTFYDCKIINKVGNALFDCQFSQFTDMDIESYSNDYVGCDTTCDAGYSYTAHYVPPVGVFQTPIQIIKKIESSIPMDFSSFMYFAISSIPQDPNSFIGFRNRQLGYWDNGAPIIFGGNGSGVAGSFPTKFSYPGNPSLCDVPGDWSECNADDLISGSCARQAPGNRKLLMNFGPFDLLLGGEAEFTFAAITTMELPSNTCVNSDLVCQVSEVIQNAYSDSLSISSESQYNLTTVIRETLIDNISVRPNPTQGVVYLEDEAAIVQVFDLKGAILLEEKSTRSIDLSVLNQGVYLITTADINGKNSVVKVIKE